jgi:hypothetical protein
VRTAVPEMRRGTVETKRGRGDVWGWKERGRESAKERDYWRDGREEGRIGFTNKGRRKGGRPGDRAGLGKMIQAFPQFEFAWEKKRGGGKVDGLSAGGVWKISGSMAIASANAKTERTARKKKKCDRDGE